MGKSIYGLLLYGKKLYSASIHDVWLAAVDNPAVTNIIVSNIPRDIVVGWNGTANIIVDANAPYLQKIYDLSGTVAIVIDGEYHPYIGPFWEPIPSGDNKWNEGRMTMEVDWGEKTHPGFVWSIESSGSPSWSKAKPKESIWRPIDPNARYPYP